MKYTGLKQKDILEKQKIYGLNIINDKKNYNLLYESIIYIFLISIIINVISKEILTTSILVLIFILYLIIIILIKKKINILNNNLNNFFCYTVIRDGKKIKVDKSNIVVGDIIIFSEFDEICVDAIILESDSLVVDESIYNKKRYVVEKNCSYVHSTSNLRSNYVYTKGVVLNGSAICKVIGTGYNTEYAKIVLNDNIDFRNKFKNNKFYYIYLFYNVLNLILFLLALVLNNSNFLSISFALLTNFTFLLVYYFIKKTLYCVSKNGLYISNYKNLYDIYIAKNIFINNYEINLQKKEITDIKPNNIDKNELLKHLFLSCKDKYLKNTLGNINIDEYNLVDTYYVNRLNYSIYKKGEQLLLFVSGNLESLFDICDLDLDFKYMLNEEYKKNYENGINSIFVGHNVIHSIVDNPLEYKVVYDGYISYKNYIDNNIIDNLNYLNNNFNTYFYMNDTKHYIKKYFSKFNNINNKYVINKKEFYSIAEEDVYNNLKDINLYSNFDNCSIHSMAKKFDKSIIFNNKNKYYIKNNNINSLVSGYKTIKRYHKCIKYLIIINIIILLVILFISFIFNYIYIIIFKFIIFIFNIVYFNNINKKLTK